MELTKSADSSDITARLDRLERSVGKLIDVISQSTLLQGERAAQPDSEPSALRELADPNLLSALKRIAALAPQLEAAAQANTSTPPSNPELTRGIQKPEISEALERIACLAPQLEYVALGAAAMPEVIEEALKVLRDKTPDTHEGAPLELRLQAIAQAGLRLSHPELVNQLSEVLVRALPLLDKLTTIDPKTLEHALQLMELTTAPELHAPLAQLFESLPALTETLLALPSDPSALAVLKAAGDAVSDVVKQGTQPLGVLGAMRAVTDPQVRRALGLAVGVARALGGKLDSPAKRLASGD
jgi:uncharacterized protein YjgD (DUF1641 family)